MMNMWRGIHGRLALPCCNIIAVFRQCRLGVAVPSPGNFVSAPTGRILAPFPDLRIRGFEAGFFSFAVRFGQKADTSRGNRMALASLLPNSQILLQSFLQKFQGHRIVRLCGELVDMSLSKTNKLYRTESGRKNPVTNRWLHNIRCNVFNVRMTLHCGLSHPSFTGKLNLSCWKINLVWSVMGGFLAEVVENKCVCVSVRHSLDQPHAWLYSP
jgi:hypothetical protein